MNVADALAEVRARIAAACARAGRAPEEVRLIAVSKKQPLERVRAAYDAGHRDFGENYLQEMEERMRALPDARWHMIGHVQTNKAKRAVLAAMVHGVDSEKLARALSKAAVDLGHDRFVAAGGPALPDRDPKVRTVEVLIEVNVGAEETKSGVAADAALPLAQAIAALPGLSLRGLMCIPPPEDSRRHFVALRNLRDHLSKSTGISLPELSMGMSGDFEDAVLEGSTMVRVGTAIFGERA